jgi:undecaprenyl diphosphate synthase
MTDPTQIARPGTEEERILGQLDLSRLPRHVAIIMDGNGRWAKQRHLPRVAGHRSGIAAVRDTIETAARLGIEVLTLYAFSRENWKRPRTEVDTLMGLLREYLGKELDTLMENNIRFRVIGQVGDLPEPIQEELSDAMEKTSGNTGLLFNIALSYSGRGEIVEACRALLKERAAAESLTEEAFSRHLQTAGQPDPDLLIRTSGELRISNFLLWQIAYAEIWVTDTLWPDFRRRHLLQAVLDFQRRERRYGGLAPGRADSPAAARR